MTRKQFFRQKIHHNKAHLLGLLCQLKQLDLVYHIDDSPADVVYLSEGNHCRTFSDAESRWLQRFIRRLDRVFTSEVTAENKGTINAGAWHATELAGFYHEVHEEQLAFSAPIRVIVEVSGGVVQCIHSSRRIDSDVLDHDNAGEDISDQDEAELLRLSEETTNLPYTQ